MGNEEEQSKINKFIKKLSRPEILLFNTILLWAAILIMCYNFDMRFFAIQDFVNDNCKAFEPMYFDVNLNATRPEINISEIPRMEHGK